MTPVPDDATLRLKTLGPMPRLVSVGDGGGETQVFGPGKPLALIIYLSLLPDRTATRVHLTDLLWADSDLEHARQSLRQAIWQVRRKLGEDALAGDGEQLTLAARITADHSEVGVALRNGRFEEVVELYEGEFLGEFGVPGGAGFEHWADGVRERLRSGWMRALEALARERLNQGRSREAVVLIRRLRDAHAANEAVWRLLFDTLLAMGDVIGAGIEADALESMLAAEHREPELQTVPFLTRVRAMPAASNAPGSSALIAELIGRQGEFRRLTQAWERTRAGEGSHLHLSAPAGIGKTRLLRDAERRLRAMGGRVLYLRAPPGSRQIAYAFAADLARALIVLPGASGVSPSSLSTILALDPSLTSLYPGPLDPSEGAEALRRRTIALADLILALGAESPVALLLDDVHWMDRDSLEAIAGLRSRLSGSPALLVTAGRPFPGSQSVEADAEVFHLRPLTEPHVEALVMSLGRLPEAEWSSALVHRLYGAAAGSPHLVLESLQLALDHGWLHRGEEGWSCSDPSRIAEELSTGNALGRRLEALDPLSRQVVSLLAIAAAPVRAAVLATAAGYPEPDIAAVLTALEVRGFISQTDDRWRLGHDELAGAALQGVDEETAQSLSALLGAALASQPAISAFDHQRAAELLLDGHEDRLLAPLYQRWLAMAHRLADPRTDTELARALLGAAATPDRLRPLLRARPVHRRLGLDTRPRRWGAAGVGVLMLGALAFGMNQGGRRATHMVMLQSPISGTEASMMPVPIIEVRDALDRRVRNAALDVHAEMVGDSLGLEGVTTVPLEDGVAIFDRLTLATGNLNAIIRFTATGLPPVEVRLLGEEGPTLWLDRAELNGQSLSPEHRVVEIAPGDTIRGVATLRFSSYWVAASIIFGAFPTWGDHQENWQTVAALPTPIINGVTRQSLTVPGPDHPGDYHLILAFTAEPDASWIASATNWSLGAPTWGDGNDLADLTASQIGEANANGQVILEWQYDVSRRNPSALAATVIEVRVR